MAKTIWDSNAQRDYYCGMSVEELAKEYDDAFGETEINGIPLNLVGKNSRLDALLEDMLLEVLFNEDIDKEDLDYCLSEISKQCYDNIIVFFGKSADWQGYHDSCKAMDIDESKDIFYPRYEANTKIVVDNSYLFFSESSHDVPGFSMGLYSFKTREDYDNAEKELLKLNENFEMAYFFDSYDYKDIKMLIDKGILTPIKNNINGYTGNEKEK